MGLIAQEIKELRRMVKMFDKNQITAADIATKLKIYKESHKRSKLILDALIACSRPNLIEGRLHGFNVLSKGEFMSLPDDIELETISCPDQGDIPIARNDCLSFSGETGNTESCNSCDNFGVTRKLLLGA